MIESALLQWIEVLLFFFFIDLLHSLSLRKDYSCFIALKVLKPTNDTTANPDLQALMGTRAPTICFIPCGPHCFVAV